MPNREFQNIEPAQPEADKPEMIQDIESGSGREIEGLESKLVSFSVLEKGRDYDITESNERVHSEHQPEEYFVFINPKKGTEQKMVNAPHWRTISSEAKTTVDVRYNNGTELVNRSEPFYVVNTKGVGYLKDILKDMDFDERNTWIKKTSWGEFFGPEGNIRLLGLAASLEFDDIIQKSQFLLENGLRTEAYWAIGNLHNVYYKGELTSIQELRDENVIIKRKDNKPAEALRLLKTNNRIEEAMLALPERRMEIFRNAFDVYNQEKADKGSTDQPLSIEEKYDQRKFFADFFERMGSNMAVILNLGYYFGGLHSSNISMAAEVADIGPADHWSLEKDNLFVCKDYNGVRRGHLKDMRDIAHSLRRLVRAARGLDLHTGSPESLVKSFMDGFDQRLTSKKIKEIQKNDPEAMRKWMLAIINRLVVEKKRLPGLLHDDELNVIENDWGIEI